MSSWVCGHLTGGLGNRLFQHSAAAGLAEKWGLPLVFYLPECMQTNHGDFDNIFKLFPDVPKLDTPVPNVQRLPEPQLAVFSYIPFPDQPVAQYNSVDGYRQTMMYFPKDGMSPTFDVAIPKERQQSLLQTYNLHTQELRENTWFIHVRLGDYLVLPHHQIDLNKYYPKAVTFIPKTANVLLFSDDIDTYGPRLQTYFENLGVSVRPVPVPDELESLFLMSQCFAGGIVANSTFSWWGAYIARMNSPTKFFGAFPTNWGQGLPPAIGIIPPWGVVVDNN